MCLAQAGHTAEPVNAWRLTAADTTRAPAHASTQRQLEAWLPLHPGPYSSHLLETTESWSPAQAPPPQLGEGASAALAGGDSNAGATGMSHITTDK